MKRNNALLIIFVITLLAVTIGGTYWYQKSYQNKENIVQTEQPEVKTTETKNDSIDFIDRLLNKLPASYTISEVEYLESFDAEPQKAMGAKPCDDKNSDPTYSPLCFTRLTILEQEKTDNLDAYIKTNKIMSWYENALSTELVKVTYQENIPSVYTPKAFMCIGTGGESCMRKRFVYHLDDGRNILAEISFWSFKNGEYVGPPSKEVQDVIDIYENLLTK